MLSNQVPEMGATLKPILQIGLFQRLWFRITVWINDTTDRGPPSQTRQEEETILNVNEFKKIE